MIILGKREAKRWKGLALADKQVPRSLGAATSNRDTRIWQVAGMSSGDVEKLLARIRQSEAVPRLRYHFEQHGAELGAGDEQEYLQRMRQHLSREDLRIFTYVRGKKHVPFWELVDLESGGNSPV